MQLCSSSTGGLKSQSEFHLDLCLVASWHELVKGGEMARSPVNCFEFELGAPLKKKDTALGSGGQSGLRGGGISQLKALRVSQVWKIMLEKIRLDVDRLFS
jgi:hypothetical protein